MLIGFNYSRIESVSSLYLQLNVKLNYEGNSLIESKTF
jgi:hypothetical protein